MIGHGWAVDPKRFGFTLARYKFVAKMFSGRKNALEIGCGDAFATRVVRQEVKSLTAIDCDPAYVADVNARMNEDWAFECRCHDMLTGHVAGAFDAVYALDVLEHIAPKDEERFLRNAVNSLIDDGVAIFGMPSLESQAYASDISKSGHINCQSQPQLKATLQKHFDNVFMFGMNDETLHTGHHAMAHYILGLCCGPKC